MGLDELEIDIERLMSDIDLALPSAKGRKPKEDTIPLFVGDPRPLTAEDVAIATNRAAELPTGTPPALVKIGVWTYSFGPLPSSKAPRIVAQNRVLGRIRRRSPRQ